MAFEKGVSEGGDMEKPTTEAALLERSDTLATAMARQLRIHEETASFPAEPLASIYRVPPSIRAGDPAAYEPQIISIGPYHHGRPDLQAMEGHKWRYLQNLFLLRRGSGAGFTEALEECIERVRESEARARRYYSEPIDLGSDDFIKMMVLDGCFMLQLFLKFYQRERNDPIFSVGWMLPLIRCDLLKLENQIPFFLLEILFDTFAVRPSSPDHVSLRDLAFIYLKMRRRSETKKFEDVFHLLHFYDLVLMPADATGEGAKTFGSPSVACSSILPIALMLPTRPPAHDRERPHGTVPSIADLSAAGVRLRRKRPAESILDVSFRHGALEIPTLAVGDDTNSIFRNLIAFEQCSPASGKYFTSYVLFLDGIINTPRDVAVLQRCGIIDNKLGSHEEVALLINQLCKRVTINYRDHYLTGLFEEVNRYCGSNWRRYRARLVHDFFSTPWTIISVYAASALLVMMFIQVVFVVRLYNKS